MQKTIALPTAEDVPQGNDMPVYKHNTVCIDWGSVQSTGTEGTLSYRMEEKTSQLNSAAESCYDNNDIFNVELRRLFGGILTVW